MKSVVLRYPKSWALVPMLLCLLAAAILPSAASADDPNPKKLPLIFKGNGYKLKPGAVYGWDPDGYGKPLRHLGKTTPNDPPGTNVRWPRWTRNHAVGFGRASSTGCAQDKCETGYPWNGTDIRVVAWRPRSGHFTRMKVTTRVPKTSELYYELVLAYRGPFTPYRTVSWKTVSETKAANTAPAKLHDGHRSLVKPTLLAGWSVLGLRSTSIRSIKWKTWGHEGKAIGIGQTINPGCKVLPCGKADALDLSVWENRRIRVTAFRARNGEYTRLKVFQWTQWNQDLQENYHFTLAAQDVENLPWRTIQLDRGIR